MLWYAIVCLGLPWLLQAWLLLAWLLLTSSTCLPWSALVRLGPSWPAFVCFGLLWSTLVCFGLPWYVLVCSGLLWSKLICLGLIGLFQITIKRLKCSKSISGTGWDWMGWKSLYALLAPTGALVVAPYHFFT